MHKPTLAILVILFALNACKTKQVNNASNDVIRIDEQEWVKENDQEAPDANTNAASNDTITIDPEASNTHIDELDLKKKAKYRIAVVLPFMADSVRQAWDISSKKNFEKFDIDPASEMSLSFTEGLLMAIDDAKFESKFEVKFFDDQNDPSAINGILNKLKKDSFDVIIGSAKKSNVQSLSNFAKREGIMHISPFSPSKSAAVNNPRYFMIEPSLDQHIISMLNYALDSVEQPHIKFIYEKNGSGKYYADIVSSFMNEWNDSLPMDAKLIYSNIELGSDLVESEFELLDHIDEDANNVVIANTFDENFLTHFLPQIQQVKEDNQLLVFGMPGWEYSETLRLDYLNTGEVHFTSSNLSSPDTIQAFIERYKEKYEGTPSQAVYTGYEMGHIFLNQLDNYGLDYYDNLIQEANTPLSRTYTFIEVKNEDNEVIRIENTSLIVYKIHEFEQVRLR